jgi:hypothetical protein
MCSEFGARLLMALIDHRLLDAGSRRKNMNATRRDNN